MTGVCAHMYSVSPNLARSFRTVLERYLSPITVEVILKRVYTESGVNPGTLTRGDLERIYQERLSLCVKMFCDQKQLTDIMLDLADLLEAIPERPGS